MTAPAELRERLDTETFRRQIELARRFNDSHPDQVESEVRFGLRSIDRMRMAHVGHWVGALAEQALLLTFELGVGQ